MEVSESAGCSALHDHTYAISEVHMRDSNYVGLDKENICLTVVQKDYTKDPLGLQYSRSPASSRNPLGLMQPLYAYPVEESHNRLITLDAVDEEQAKEPAKGRYRSRVRTRGGVRRRNRKDTDAVNCDMQWQKSEPMIEVCLSDIPQILKEMICDLESSHPERIVKHVNKQRKLCLNDDYIVHKMFDDDKSALNFKWSSKSPFQGEQETFHPHDQPGPCRPFSCCYDAFRQFWDNEILEHIVKETNLRAKEIYPPGSLCARNWYDTNIHEVLVLFAFWITLSVIKMPTIALCYYKHPMSTMDIFRRLFTRRRYVLLSRVLFFADNTNISASPSKLFYVKPLVDHLNKKFKEAYIPSKDIRIHKSPTLWKGMKHASDVRMKGTRVYVKTYELFEAYTGYLWSFDYVVKDRRPAPSSMLNKTRDMKIAIRLISPLLNKGYRLFMENWYNALVIARYLKRNSTDCVATLQKTQKYVPNSIKSATIPKGTCIARHSGDMMVMMYQDKKSVYTISTCHNSDSTLVPTKSAKSSHYEPTVIVDYNKAMKDVYGIDETLEPSLFFKRNKRQLWYITLLKRLLNMSVLNSRVLISEPTNDPERLLALRMDLIDEIVKRHLIHVRRPRKTQVYNRAPTVPNPLSDRFNGTHYIIRNVIDKGGSRTKGIDRVLNGRRYCKRCMVVAKQYRYTVWKCKQCGIPLCLISCFEKYHTTDLLKL